MKRSLIIVAVLAVVGCKMFNGGGSKPPAPPAITYEMDHTKWVGLGLWNWIHVDPNQTAEFMRHRGLNVFALGIGCCTENPDGTGPVPPVDIRGDSMYKIMLTAWMEAMKANGITVLAQLASGNGPDACSPAINDEWFVAWLDYFKQYDYMTAIGPVNELGHGSSSACHARLQRFCDLTEERWPGLKVWNGESGHPSSNPEGWAREYHPFSQYDLSAPGAIIYNDARTGDLDWLNADGYINQPAVIDYGKRVHEAGRGFILLFPWQNGGKMDWSAIQALGEACK